jgi:4-hydroxybenzoate polyprenyltransferase
LRKQLFGYLRLARYKEFFFFVVITTLLGASAGSGYFGWTLVGVLIANWLAVAFAFMINDVEDANDDALDPAKRCRNPISSEDLSPRSGRIACLAVASGALVIYALCGLWPFVIGVNTIAIGFLYSWKRVRFKSIPGLDLISHGLMLSGLQFLAAYFAFEYHPNSRWIFPWLLIISISLYGELFNELRDAECDRKAGIHHTASVLGPRPAYALMVSLLIVGISSAVVTIFIVHLLPNWVLISLGAFILICMIPSLINIRRKKSSLAIQESFQKPVEVATAFALFAHFVAPWAAQMLNLGMIH